MEAAYSSKTLATQPTFTKCQHPKTESALALNGCKGRLYLNYISAWFSAVFNIALVAVSQQ
jgi:hypothetical protein